MTGRHSEYYSKLAHLELCGWIELAQDDIVLRVAKLHIKDSQNLKDIRSSIKRNSSMGQTNFKSMIVEVIGRSGFEKLESLVNSIHQNTLEIELKSLRDTRNAHAHTNIKDCTRTLDAPSTNLARFERIFEALKEYERKIKILKL
ncbi:MAG: endoribonuclease [Methylococcaceae bacterium]|nr:endoribonuclease [Methylococcaceae bacterium]